MKCHLCKNEGKLSKLYCDVSSRTCIGWSQYYDEDGIIAGRDPNITTSRYHCSNGHAFVVKSKQGEPDWIEEDVATIQLGFIDPIEDPTETITIRGQTSNEMKNVRD